MVAEGPDEHFVYGGDSHLPKCLVGSVILVEDRDDDVIGVSKFGDLGDQRDQWDGGIGAWVDGSDEGRGRECCVHGRGDGEV